MDFYLARINNWEDQNSRSYHSNILIFFVCSTAVLAFMEKILQRWLKAVDALESHMKIFKIYFVIARIT